MAGAPWGGLYNESVLSARLPRAERAHPKTTSAPDLAVVVINYDSGDHLRTCLAALPAASGDLSAEFVVVDNASQDGSLDGVEDGPGLRILRSAVNDGYGRACNRGAAASSGRFLCLLNPDVVPEPGSLERLGEALARRPGVGIIGPRLLNPDGTVYPSCRVVPSLTVALGHALLGFFRPGNRFSRRYQLLDWDHDTEREVEWLSGAAMVIRREAFEAVGGFDEGFFMYMEDVDLCDRVRAAGYSALYYPHAAMLHHVAGSSRRAPYRMIRHHHFSLMRYSWNKTKGTPKVILFPLIVAGVLMRMVLAWLDCARRARAGSAPGRD